MSNTTTIQNDIVAPTVELNRDSALLTQYKQFYRLLIKFYKKDLNKIHDLIPVICGLNPQQK